MLKYVSKAMAAAKEAKAKAKADKEMKK